MITGRVVKKRVIANHQTQVIVQLTSCDGAVAACAGNAAHLALLDAGVAMKATAMCISLAVTWKNI